MEWDTARSAAETLLRWTDDDFEIGFSGGEPLLAGDLMRRFVTYFESRRPAGSKVRYVVTTNGTLLDRAMTAFLVDHDMQLRLSFDGVRAAQDLRDPASFDVLHSLAGRLRTDYPDYFRSRVSIGSTVSVASIPYLADSATYLLGLQIENIQIEPVVTWEGDWDAAAERELGRQIDRILEISLDHWQRVRSVPVNFLVPEPGSDTSMMRPPFACGACIGNGVSVDPDGRAWGCHLFSSSVQEVPPMGQGVSKLMDLGHIADPFLDQRLAELPRRALEEPILGNLDTKCSMLGACRDCEFLHGCVICPASAIHLPVAHDPLRVPDFSCVFSRLTQQAAAEFRRRTAAARFFDLLDRFEDPLQQLNEAISKAS